MSGLKKLREKFGGKALANLGGLAESLELPVPKVQWSVRLSIVALMTMLIIFTSGLTMLIYYLGTRKSVKLLTDNLMLNMVDRMVDKSLDYLGSASAVSELSEKLTQHRVLEPGRESQLLTYFQEVLAINESFNAVFYADSRGNFIMEKRMPDGTVSAMKVRGAGVPSWSHATAGYAASFNSGERFDPRQRPWYKEAVEQKELVWTNVYIFASDKIPGITCAIPIKSGNTVRGVLGIDVSLVELSKYLSSVKIGDDSRTFIFDAEKMVIAAPVGKDGKINLVRSEKKEGKENLSLFSLMNHPNGEIVSSQKALEKASAKLKKKKFKKFREKFRKKLFKEKEIPHHFRFKHDGNDYVGMFAPFPEDSPWRWNVGLIVPESVFIDSVQRTNVITFIVAIFLIGLAVYAGYFFAGRMSKPLSELAVEMDKIGKFQLDSRTEISSGITEVQNMVVTFAKMKYGLRSFRKFVPADLVRELIDMEHEAELGGEKKVMTVYFSDIAGFTSISEKLTPEQLVENLAEYLGEMSRIITQHKGTLDKYIGDAVMAFWGAPRELANHAEKACEAALACRDRLREMAGEWEKKGKPVFMARIGLNSGELIVGNMGSEERLNYTVIGDTVNLASRLEAVNKVYGTSIMIGQGTYDMVKDMFTTRRLDFVAVKGKKEAVGIYELVARPEKVTVEEKEFIRAYEKGLDLYLKKDWDGAEKTFKEAESLRRGDISCGEFLSRIEVFRRNPPPTDWNGEFVMTHK